MKQKTYRETTVLRTCDCDFTGEWRPSAILTVMQEIAGMHSHLLGCGREVLIQRNIVWVLTRSEIRMERYPRVGDTVTAETWPAPVRRWFFPRYYLFRDGEGNRLGCAATLWVLMDFTARKMTPPGEVGAMLPDNGDLTPPMGLPGTVEALDGEASVRFRAPAYFDLDVNQHVNNTRYADWACDELGVEVMREYALAQFRINYEAEIKPEQNIALHLTRSGDRFNLTGMQDDTRHFEMDGLLKRRKE